MKFKTSLTIALLTVVAFFIYSCSGNSGDQNPNTSTDTDASVKEGKTFVDIADSDSMLPDWSNENTLIFHFIGEPDDMHPTNGNAASRTFLFNYTQRFLVASDIINLDVRPDLVKSMPEISEDELEFTYELRDGITWDDGEEVTLEDVIFTYKANKCPLTNNPHAKPYLENLKTIRTYPDNPNKFTLVMKRKYIQNIVFLTDYPILQRTYFDPNNTLSKYTFEQFDDKKFDVDAHADLNDWATEFNNPKYSRDPAHLVGLGAYDLVEWKADQSITLKKKDNHWTSKLENPTPYETAYPKEIIFKINKDANSQLLEFKSQAMDASTYLSTKTLLDLQQDATFNKNYHSRFTDTYNFSYMAFNMKPDGVEHKKFFTDQKVRRAVAHLVPVDMINSVLNHNKNTRMVGPVSPLKEAHNDTLELIQYNLEKAKTLLDEAGWVDTDDNNIRDKMIDGEKIQFEFDLHYMTTQGTWKDMAQMISEELYKAGLKANIVPLDFKVHYDYAKNHKFDAMLAAWASSSFPSDFTQIWHTSSWASKGSNFTGYGDAESDALIDSIKYTLDDDIRHELVRQLQADIYEEQPYVFLFAGTRRNVIHKRFANADMYFERPGVILNNLKLLTLPERGNAAKATASAQ